MIETKRLIFRRWTKEDAAALYALASDPEVGPHAGWPVHTSIEESRAVIKEYFSNDGRLCQSKQVQSLVVWVTIRMAKVILILERRMQK